MADADDHSSGVRQAEEGSDIQVQIGGRLETTTYINNESFQDETIGEDLVVREKTHQSEEKICEENEDKLLLAQALKSGSCPLTPETTLTPTSSPRPVAAVQTENIAKREKKEEPGSDEDIATRSAAADDPTAAPSPVDILSQIFPARSRHTLESVLHECNGDLVRALERCARSGRELLMQQAVSAAAAAATERRSGKSQDINGNGSFSAAALAHSSQHVQQPPPTQSKFLSAFTSHKSAFVPPPSHHHHPYHRHAQPPHAPAESSFLHHHHHQQRKEMFPFPPPPPPPFFGTTSGYLAAAAAAAAAAQSNAAFNAIMSPLQHHLNRQMLSAPPSTSSSSESFSSRHHTPGRPCTDPTCPGCPKVESAAGEHAILSKRL
jgi:hypothetical protein